MDKLRIEAIENDILEAFKHNRLCWGEKPKEIIIESGAANDMIIDYELVIHETNTHRKKEVFFTTTASIFPRHIQLSDFDSVDLEVFNGNLFVHVN